MRCGAQGTGLRVQGKEFKRLGAKGRGRKAQGYGVWGKDKGAGHRAQGVRLKIEHLVNKKIKTGVRCGD